MECGGSLGTLMPGAGRQIRGERISIRVGSPVPGPAASSAGSRLPGASSAGSGCQGAGRQLRRVAGP